MIQASGAIIAEAATFYWIKNWLNEKYIICSYLQIIIPFSLTILPFHRNTLSKIVFSSSSWFVLQIPTGTEINGKHVPGHPSDPKPSRVVLSMEPIIILMNMIDAHLQRNWAQRKFWPFCLHVHTSWLPNESHTNVPDPIFKRNSNSTRGYQIKLFLRPEVNWRNYSVQGSHTYFFTKIQAGTINQ